MNDYTRRGLLGAGAVGLAGALSGCTAATPFVGKRREFDRELDVTDGSVTVASESGDATVRRTDADAVELHVVKTAASVFADVDRATVETTREGDRLEIRTRVASDEWYTFGGGPTVDLSVGVPEGVTVESVGTASGDARVEDVAGDVDVHTTNGTAAARNVDGAVSLRSTNGDVSARGVTAVRWAETTNGDVDVEVPALVGETPLTTTNGDIDAALATDLDATVVARTTNGDVTTSGLSLDDVETGDGHLRGTLGDGGHRLTARSTNGDVTLSSLP